MAERMAERIPRVGELFVLEDDKVYEITSVMPRVSRFDHAGQTTGIEGYTTGLVVCPSATLHHRMHLNGYELWPWGG